MTDEEFYRLTPRQFHLLVDQHRERVEHQELLTGIIASTVANWSMGAPKQPLSPSDFMLSRKRDPVKKERLNRKRVSAQIRSVMMGLAGK